MVGRADIQVLLFAEKAAIILVFVHRRDLVLAVLPSSAEL
jgi:hypothetical protein